MLFLRALDDIIGLFMSGVLFLGGALSLLTLPVFMFAFGASLIVVLLLIAFLEKHDNVAVVSRAVFKSETFFVLIVTGFAVFVLPEAFLFFLYNTVQ